MLVIVMKNDNFKKMPNVHIISNDKEDLLKHWSRKIIDHGTKPINRTSPPLYIENGIKKYL
jgi:hypothetical protein